MTCPLCRVGLLCEYVCVVKSPQKPDRSVFLDDRAGCVSYVHKTDIRHEHNACMRAPDVLSNILAFVGNVDTLVFAIVADNSEVVLSTCIDVKKTPASVAEMTVRLFTQSRYATRRQRDAFVGDIRRHERSLPRVLIQKRFVSFERAAQELFAATRTDSCIFDS